MYCRGQFIHCLSICLKTGLGEPQWIFSGPTSGGVSSRLSPVCVSVQLTKLFNIFGSEWDIFLKSFGDIPRMIVHYFWIILNLLYVCQSVSWLSSSLKLDKDKDISSSGWDTFLKFFGDSSSMLAHQFQIIQNFLYFCQSGSWLTSLLKVGKYRDVSYSWWFFFLIFFRYSWDVFTLFPNAYKFLVCLSVSCPTSILIF